MSAPDSLELGLRVRRLRLITKLGQIEFADRLGIASGSVSKLENGRLHPLSDALIVSIADLLDVSPAFLTSGTEAVSTTKPWLRAYADASKRAVDRQIADSSVALEVVSRLGLPRFPDVVPHFEGDLTDDEQIESFATDVRAAAQIEEGDVVRNATRAAERLGCVVLPMDGELGRHLGMSLRADLTPVISVSRPSFAPDALVPGDRQRFTVAHEIGHIALHSDSGPPNSADEAARIEKQAHLFAGAFLAPGDAMLEELAEFGGRVTLSTLVKIKERWGVAVKMLVMRFRQLGVIDNEAARSLYKQISARGWNKSEPVEVPNEQAAWFGGAVTRWAGRAGDPIVLASETAGVGMTHLRRWTDWTPAVGTSAPDDVVDLDARRARLRARRSFGA